MNLALCAAAAAGVQVGAAIVASRFALQEVPPLTLAMLRYAVGALVLLPFAVRALRGNPVRPLPRDLVAMAAPGIGQFGVLIALLNLGLQRLSSAQAVLASVAALAVLAGHEQWPARMLHFSATAWAVIAIVGLSSGIGYFWWLCAFKHESPTRVTVFLALNPVTATLLGWALLGESPGAATWLAMALVASGVWLDTRPADNPAP